LTQLVTKSDESYRMYVGHAGWSPGQLETELEQGSWLTTPATADLVFYDGDDLWDKVRDLVVKSSLLDHLGVKYCPPNPRMN
jgi:putative transcriptional regulator